MVGRSITFYSMYFLVWKFPLFKADLPKQLSKAIPQSVDYLKSRFYLIICLGTSKSTNLHFDQFLQKKVYLPTWITSLNFCSTWLELTEEQSFVTVFSLSVFFPFCRNNYSISDYKSNLRPSSSFVSLWLHVFRRRCKSTDPCSITLTNVYLSSTTPTSTPSCRCCRPSSPSLSSTDPAPSPRSLPSRPQPSVRASDSSAGTVQWSDLKIYQHFWLRWIKNQTKLRSYLLRTLKKYVWQCVMLWIRLAVKKTQP